MALMIVRIVVPPTILLLMDSDDAQCPETLSHLQEREELVYIDGVRDSCMHSAENSSNTVCRDGSVVDLNSYFLSYSTRNNHERVEEPFSIRFKEKPHIKHQIQNYLENCVHVQVCVCDGDKKRTLIIIITPLV